MVGIVISPNWPAYAMFTPAIILPEVETEGKAGVNIGEIANGGYLKYID